MSRDCPRYTLAKAATNISVREGVLYIHPLRAARIQEKQKVSPTASTPSTEPPALAAGRPAKAERRDAGPYGESNQRSRPPPRIPEVACADQAPADTVCNAVSDIYAAAAQSPDASSATSATTPDVRHH